MSPALLALEQVFKSFGPEFVSLWDNQVLPAIQKYEASKNPNADWGAAESALNVAAKAIGDYELAKI